MLNSLLAHLLPRSWLARWVLQWLVLLLSCEEWVVLRHQILQKNDKIDLTL